jgi:peptide/nickel transport system permease protein
MVRYIVRRLLISLPMLVGITLIIFLLANMMPGDALTAMMSDEAPTSQKVLEARREALGLDKPLPMRYLNWVGKIVRGNLGYSYITFVPIGQTILKRIPATLELMGTSLLISILVGVCFGIISAIKQYSGLDYVLTVAGFIGLSIPVFFLGMMLIYVFALKLDWFPVSGIATVGTAFSLKDNLWHLALPGISLAVLRTAVFMRYSRASMLEVLRSDFMMTARAKGFREKVVVMKHGFRNALIPIITIIGLNIRVLFGGAVIIESVFQWPGMGSLFITAVTQRDYPMIMGLTLMTSIVVLLSNLLTDIVYAFVDPRIHYD